MHACQILSIQNVYHSSSLHSEYQTLIALNRTSMVIFSIMMTVDEITTFRLLENLGISRESCNNSIYFKSTIILTVMIHLKLHNTFTISLN